MAGFEDRVVEYPGRVTLTLAEAVSSFSAAGDTITVDMVRAEGEEYASGTLLNAANLKDCINYPSLDTTAAAGTVDGDLYAALVALGWDSEVITE